MDPTSRKALLRRLASHRGRYGIDGGWAAVRGLSWPAAAGLLLFGLALLPGSTKPLFQRALEFLGGAALLQLPASFFYSTLRGKFSVWAELLEALQLRGDERALEMGCGRGAILAILAKLLPQGRAVGIDLWRTEDQSGNSLESARQNLAAEGVAERCELHTGDLRALPFPNDAFDLVISNLAIHNIPLPEGRKEAIREAVRVLKPGGRLLIADLFRTEEYVEWLPETGMTDVALRRLDWRFWYGIFGVTPRLVTARKPPDHPEAPGSSPHLPADESGQAALR
ncbi:Demethylrebeccamycin-D-glucose O-methyltransferase [Methylacidimicrobium cyclopophantes]|uniref:Demethylrebeccamycin-D-glucose O-methyltransferase n=1 Tax=Methylacidimicrobium cyclopophantes TaxID=1041766 RepID=A0A5E6MMB2_9BACT|nr:class I SAM-dependent methyltransferase [Methylacidimicrobium cyclopophantes]VVM07200.1 Demethylrebeccamycin-D-glucose O-methyltransferase [Methylacidimicrobium cyclopophantes]